ncbi:MAG TPA: DUF72 domain-containing protein [Gaiellaceae bacterium]|nr:DUF72 domain-containing protein [Gaiellaceae bacterium]
MPEVRIGCSGWNYAHWRDVLYPRGLPQARWLARYAETFDTVEVNATFYRLPTRKAAEGWAQATPPGFLFAVKASRYLTHLKRLRDLRPGLERFRERIAPLAEAGKLGPILWQLPESFHRDDDRLREALEALGEGRHCFEFRHASWFAPEVERLLAAHDAALVIADHVRRPFQTLARPASWTYLRFHHGRGRDGSYTHAQLRTWAERVRAWAAEGDVYAYFNDDWAGYAVREARILKELVA